MSIEYDLFANPPKNGEEKPTLHARAINIQTVNTNELARMIESMSTFTTADIKGAIKAISEKEGVDVDIASRMYAQQQGWTGWEKEMDEWNDIQRSYMNSKTKTLADLFR